MIEYIMLKNTISGSKLLLNMHSDNGYILSECLWGNVSGNHNSYKYSGQVGQTVTNTTLETRDVEITGYVYSYDVNLLSIMKRNLNRLINPQHPMELFYDRFVLTFMPDNTIQYGVDHEDNNNVICKFRIRGTAYDPVFREVKERKIEGARFVPAFRFPLVISKHLPAIDGVKPRGMIFGYKRKNLILSVPNSGDVDVGFKFSFKANQDGVVNPTLINIFTQEQFKINKTLQANEIVNVNTITGSKSVTGGIDEISNYYKYKNIDSVWLTLKVGDNLFRYDADENVDGLQTDIVYNSEYLEVEGDGEEQLSN